MEDWQITSLSIKNILENHIAQTKGIKANIKLHGSIFKSKGVFGKGPFLKATYKKLVREGLKFTIKEETIYHDEIQDILAKFFDRDNIESFDIVLDSRQTPTGIVMHLVDKNGFEMKLTPKEEN